MKETRGVETVELALLPGINEWSVDQVAQLFRKCKLTGPADAVVENQIDGKTLCDLSDNDLYSKVEDGGLGLKPLQLKRIRAELGESSNASSVGSAASLCQKSGNRQTDDSADSNARTERERESERGYALGTKKNTTLQGFQINGDKLSMCCVLMFA